MKPDPIDNANIFTDECMMENFSENYHLCQLIRDESFGWPISQDPDLDADPFTGPCQPLDFDISVFDSADREREGQMDWNQLWPAKPQSSDIIPEAAWQQLAINLDSPTSKTRRAESTSLTPSLVALEFPKASFDERQFSLAKRCDEYSLPQKRREYFPNHQNLEGSHEYINQWDYQQIGDLGRGTYVVQQAAGPGDVITIGIYTRAERAAKIHRFRQKRERRNFSKRVLYCSRKRFADSRPRVGGRFVINENRVVKPKMFLKRGRPRKSPMMLPINLAAALLLH